MSPSATYEQIKAYLREHSGLTVSPLYIAQVKRKFGTLSRECCNKAKSESAKMPICPPDKEKAMICLGRNRSSQYSGQQQPVGYRPCNPMFLR